MKAALHCWLPQVLLLLLLPLFQEASLWQGMSFIGLKSRGNA